MYARRQGSAPLGTVEKKKAKMCTTEGCKVDQGRIPGSDRYRVGDTLVRGDPSELDGFPVISPYRTVFVHLPGG